MTAPVERGPSQGARSGSKESSSCLCVTSSETARCTSTGDHQICPLTLLLRTLIPLQEEQANHPSLRASATTALSWGLCEQEEWLPAPSAQIRILLLSTNLRERPDCRSLRASNEHSFTVRGLRARKTSGRSRSTFLAQPRDRHAISAFCPISRTELRHVGRVFQVVA